MRTIKIPAEIADLASKLLNPDGMGKYGQIVDIGGDLDAAVISSAEKFQIFQKMADQEKRDENCDSQPAYDEYLEVQTRVVGLVLMSLVQHGYCIGRKII